MFRKILFVILNLVMAANIVHAQQNKNIEEGRKLYALFAAGNTDSIWNLMTPSFQTAVHGKEGFENLVQQLNQSIGKEVVIKKEDAFVEEGYTSYYRISQYEKHPDITMRWVWDQDGKLLGIQAAPTPTPAATAYLDYRTKTALQLPFAGTWYVAWGGREPYLNSHIIAPDQRFAYDFVYSKNGKLSDGVPKKNDDYYGFGQPVLAPADGTIITAIDTVQDNVLGVMNSNAPAGNYVVIDHGNGEFSLLAHFKSGSIKVKKGDKVRAGDLLGACGNSGHSSLPHLHYHLQTGPAYKEGVGLPAFFQYYSANNTSVKFGEPVRGQWIHR